MATIALPLRARQVAISGTTIPLALGLLGVALTWFGAAWDVSWHRLIGRDTFWSAPHLFLYGGISLWGLAALVASKKNPIIAPYYEKLRAAGKTGKQALTACMRKLLVILNAILRDRKPWQPA